MADVELQGNEVVDETFSPCQTIFVGRGEKGH